MKRTTSSLERGRGRLRPRLSGGTPRLVDCAARLDLVRVRPVSRRHVLPRHVHGAMLPLPDVTELVASRDRPARLPSAAGSSARRHSRGSARSPGCGRTTVQHGCGRDPRAPARGSSRACRGAPSRGRARPRERRLLRLRGTVSAAQRGSQHHDGAPVLRLQVAVLVDPRERRPVDDSLLVAAGSRPHRA